MIDFDQAVRDLCARIGAFYRRYSDDILVICAEDHAAHVEAELGRLIAAEKLEISPAKTERTLFDMGHPPPRIDVDREATYRRLRNSSIEQRTLREHWRSPVSHPCCTEELGLVVSL